MKKKQFSFYVSILILVVCIFIGIAFKFIMVTQEDLDKQNNQYLNEIAIQSAASIRSKVDVELDRLNDIAIVISHFDTFDIEMVMGILSLEESISDFKRLAFIPPDGSAVTTDNTNFNVLDRQFFIDAMNGKATISGRLDDRTDGEDINVYAVPLYHQGNFMGAIIATVSTDIFTNLLSSSTFYDEGYSYLIEKDGTSVVFSSHSDSVGEFDNFYQILLEIGTSEEIITELSDNLAIGASGSFEFTRNGIQKIAVYTSVGLNDWHIVSIVPKSVIYKNTQRLMMRSFGGTALIFLLLGGLLIFIIAQNRKHSRELEHLAYTDPLTGGNNLNSFKLLAEGIIRRYKNNLYMISIDVDNLKLINDMYGFDEGDSVLNEVSQMLSAFDTRYASCRMGNDDFLVLAGGSADEFILRQDNDFRRKFEKLLNEKGKRYTIRFTTAAYRIPLGETDIDTIVDRAIMAHKIAQTSSSTRCVFYNTQLRENAIAVKNIENRMMPALENHEFKVYLQPKYNIDTGKMEGAEALCRWDLNGEITSPADFIPIFEANGFIVNLDLYVLEEVCKMQKAWSDAGLNPLPISVNQSKALVYGNDYVENLCSIVERYELPPCLIELELLETIIHDNITQLLDVINRLHSYGFIICIDDFGKGYSSLHTLSEINADILKIDRDFLLNLNNGNKPEFILATIISLAKGLDMGVVAEGIEEVSQVNILKKLECDVAQGYLYAKPMPTEEYQELLRNNTIVAL